MFGRRAVGQLGEWLGAGPGWPAGPCWPAGPVISGPSAGCRGAAMPAWARARAARSRGAMGLSVVSRLSVSRPDDPGTGRHALVKRVQVAARSGRRHRRLPAEPPPPQQVPRPESRSEDEDAAVRPLALDADLEAAAAGVRLGFGPTLACSRPCGARIVDQLERDSAQFTGVTADGRGS